MARKVLAIITIILGASVSVLYLYYAPSHLALSIADPPPTTYSSNVTAIYVNLTEIDIHSAGAADESGWHTLTTGVTLNLMSVLSTSKLLGTTTLSPGKYDELRFLASQAVITINGTNETYTIPSGDETGIKAPITNGGFHIYGGESLTVQLDLSFNNNEIMKNPNMKLTPVATAQVV
jgi:hypothetical protein